MNYMTGKTELVVTDNNNADNEEFNGIFSENDVDALR